MKIYYFTIALLVAQLVFAQENETTKPVLPKYQTETELQLGQQKKNVNDNFYNSFALPADLVVPGEFEESQAVLISWPYPSSATNSYAKLWCKLARGIQEAGATVWIQVDVASDTVSVKSMMAANGTAMTNYKFILKRGDAYWARDFGPWGYYSGVNDDLSLIDLKYYPNRTYDDVVSDYVATNVIGVPLYKSKIRFEGGNFMVDGFGNGFYSTRLLDNNQSEQGWTNAGTRDSMKKVFNLTRVTEPSKLVCDGGTGHIDMYLKMIDEQTIILSEYPNTVTASDRTTIENNTALLQTLNSVYGRPYKIFKMPMPSTNTGTFSSTCTQIDNDARGYINGLTVNKTFIVPIFSATTGNIAGDSAAVQRYRKILPGYRIFPIDARLLTLQGGAIHCITMQIPADNPIRFWHPSIEGLQPAVPNYHIVSKITNRSGIAQALCLWRIKGTSTWNNVSLGDSAGYFIGDIPNMNFLATDTIEYYLDATSNNGKNMTKPIVAPTGGYYTFYTTGTFTGTDLFNEYDETYLFNAQPNPATMNTTIPVYLKNSVSIKIDICDVLGKSMAVITEHNGQKGINSYQVNTESLTPGVYFYTLYLNGDKYKTRKLVIHK